jgi:hypothetical protein
MRAPKRITQWQFGRIVFEWLKAHTREIVQGDNDYRYECLNCGSRIMSHTVFFSIHDAAFHDLCAGPGDVVRLGIPYCPKCEPKPDESGCIHIDFESESMSLQDIAWRKPS